METTNDKYLPLFYAASVVLQANQEYCQRLFDLIQTEITRVNSIQPTPPAPHEYIQLNRLSEYLATELVNHGYSKNYLFNRILFLSNNASQIPFVDAYTKLRALSTKHQELFTVVFRLLKVEGKTKKIDINDPSVLKDAEIVQLEAINKKAADFFSRKEYFINAHSIVYLKRNLIEFCMDLKRLKIEQTIPNFNMDLKFLKDAATYDFIVQNHGAAYPLLALRASMYKKLVTHSSEIKELIQKHRKNLEWHIPRCYRIRNEIVHDAAIHLNIEAINGNLKYYLTFILNDIIAYLDNNPIDINSSGSISIEDYFILQEIRYKSIEKAGFSFDQLIEEISVTEIFT